LLYPITYRHPVYDNNGGVKQKKKQHCSCALAAAVKGAAFAFILTLDSGGKGTIIETGWKRSAS
jgi:hypothetical protein